MLSKDECQTLLIRKIKEMWQIYKEYNPNADYLTAYAMKSTDDRVTRVSFSVNDDVDDDTKISIWESKEVNDNE